MMNWFARQRQNFIGEHIGEHGWIGPQPVMDYFEISRPQASADLQVWRENNPKVLTYDFKKKRWEN